jgi:hypothetical protein
MSFKKIALFLTPIVSVVIVAISVIPRDGNNGLFSLHKDVEIHSLTGLPGVEAPVFVVKIDDTTPAHPQVGVGQADVVYIEQVEGGLTRLAAVFSSHIPTFVGPVRSARISDIDLLAQFGRVAFAYSGAQSKFLPVLAAANILDVGAMHYGPKFYFNSSDRTPPYAMLLRFSELISEMETRSAQTVNSKSIGFTFSATPPDSAESFAFTEVTMRWPAARYVAKWSAQNSKFDLLHNGNADIDESGINVGPENILIQLVSVTDSEYKDKVGGVTPFIQTVGNGSCYLLRDGRAHKCLWSRSAPESPTLITDSTGKALAFTPGRTWVALVATETEFLGKSAPSPAPSKSK